VAVWCFLRERFVAAGVLCLAVALAFKPQDAGLVWLYFLLAGGVYRRRALQTLLATVALSLPGVLWVWHAAPHWMQELHSNILRSSLHGDINDPGQASASLVGAIDLQTVFSLFWSEPRIYNLVTYLMCGPLILLWILVTVRSRYSLPKAWLALAAISALSMLPVYHRQYDAKLLLLTVPACAMLWAEGGMIGRLALLVNSAGFVLTGDIPSMILLGLNRKLQTHPTGPSGRMLTDGMVFRIPLILLIMGIFYLWVYVSRRSDSAASPESESPAETPIAPTMA
jgi:hypothetical protein